MVLFTTSLWSKFFKHLGWWRYWIPLYGIRYRIRRKNFILVTLFAEKGSMRDLMKVQLTEFVWSDVL
jgi:hypothetical protein